ncbi:alpha/beta fold hydrolase [Candidatus Falkowbacteria bacterium]|nr:alpha/beta fold hydrolase [Candidatus Falkowbacteria bacterium]
MNQVKIQKTDPKLYFKGGSSKAVLILHGFAANIEQTDTLFNYFVRKGYTVFRPVMPGHSGNIEDLKEYGPNDWLSAARSSLEILSEESQEVYMIGTSFGGSLALHLASEEDSKVKALVALEMPLFFNLKIWLLLNTIQPILQLLGREYISKGGPLYRKNSVPRQGAFAFIPVRPAGQIRKFIRQHSYRDLKKLKKPFFLLQADKSDMLNNKRAINLVSKLLPDRQLRVMRVPIDNHDLNLLDDEGKMIMLEKIHDFINQE